MAVVSTGSVLQDSYTILYNILTDQINDIGDTRAGSDIIFSAWPNRANLNRSNWAKYPLVVLTTDIDSGNEFTMGASKINREVRFTAEVYNKSQANADQMADDILNILRTTRLSLAGSGLRGFRVDSVSSRDEIDPAGALVHVKTVNWLYDYKENE